VGYCALAASIDPYSAGAYVAVAVPVMVALAIALGDGWHRASLPRTPHLDAGSDHAPPRPVRHRGALITWAALLGLLAAWQVVLFTSSPRDDHPTFSSLTIEVMEHGALRAAVWAAWMVLGWYVVRR
jgi:hypothetical protein